MVSRWFGLSVVGAIGLVVSGCAKDGDASEEVVVPDIQILPASPIASDTLECVLGDEVEGSAEIQWTINEADAGTGAELADGFLKSDAVGCTTTLTDGTVLSASVTVQNAPPVLDSVSLAPEDPTAAEEVACIHGDATDIDDDASVSYLYSWTRNGSPMETEQAGIEGGILSRDDVIQCHVTPTDGEDNGESVSSQELTVANSVPRISGLAIEPADPMPDDTLVCDYTAFSDADNDADESLFAWKINGVHAGSGTVLSSGFESNDQVICTVVAFDGIAEATPVSVVATIGGSADDCDDDGDGYWSASSARWECEVLEETNYYRSTGYNCVTEGKFPPAPPLTMQFQLRKSARLHSEWMADTGTFSHSSVGGPNGDDMVERIESAGYSGWRNLGENIGAGYTSPAAAVKGWMDSDGHCANIMNSSFTELGVGYYYDSGSRWEHWWTQNFGRR